jgi:AbrB family looped-hinge helix DNA binding protein
MKIAAQGQIRIPKRVQKQFGLKPGTNVELVPENGRVYIRKKATARRVQGWEKWIGYCRKSFENLGNPSVDEYIEMVRGR